MLEMVYEMQLKLFMKYCSNVF